MSVQETPEARQARIIVVGNEKGGSGKSTVAMHTAIALLKTGQSVATIDLDSRQQSLTNYLDNRRDWAARRGRELAIPDHIRAEDILDSESAQDEQAASEALGNAVNTLAASHEFVVIDTPGHDSCLMRLAHVMADTLITPLNDSFVDFDVLGSVDPESLEINDANHYAKMVQDAGRQRVLLGHAPTDWIVLRNRLSMLSSRNKKLMGESLERLSEKLGFRYIDGLAERVIFREFFLRGLTALDGLDEATLDARPTLSHVTARQEVENLILAMRLAPATAHDQPADPSRDAA